MSQSNVFCLVEDAAFVRRSLVSFQELRAHALAIRAEQRATATLAERVAMSDVLGQIDRWISDARSWLAARGLPCNEPAEPASMAHGCAVFASAVGPAPALLVVANEQRERSASDITTPANPLFCDPALQKLQSGGDASITAQRGEAR